MWRCLSDALKNLPDNFLIKLHDWGGHAIYWFGLIILSGTLHSRYFQVKFCTELLKTCISLLQMTVYETQTHNQLTGTEVQVEVFAKWISSVSPGWLSCQLYARSQEVLLHLKIQIADLTVFISPNINFTLDHNTFNLGEFIAFIKSWNHYRTVNVDVICDAPLALANVLSRWSGSKYFIL